ncbi:unnamed protein product [Dovyalis caffra]|uniref:B-like cyclin n=1 Tax=Dovyalis caffra TaxID=77055 RepID=A0AAV1RTW6_9ROSI|nr:unnamed protein product [Dovyalis caffra]
MEEMMEVGICKTTWVASKGGENGPTYDSWLPVYTCQKKPKTRALDPCKVEFSKRKLLSAILEQNMKGSKQIKAKSSLSPVNLYCNETAGDALCSNNADDEINSLSSTDFPVDFDESYIDDILVSELQQMPETELINRFLDMPEVGTAHQDTLNWMLKVHAYYRFRPETAYLSVNYFHCFILSRTLQQGKGWPLQLLAVACLSLAAKMEETRVPTLLDVQILEPRFLFKPSTVQRMELLVMGNLNYAREMPFKEMLQKEFQVKPRHVSKQVLKIEVAYNIYISKKQGRIVGGCTEGPSTHGKGSRSSFSTLDDTSHCVRIISWLNGGAQE